MPKITQKMFDVSMHNAIENGYDFDGMTPDEIAEDVMQYDCDFEDADQDKVEQMAATWLTRRRIEERVELMAKMQDVEVVEGPHKGCKGRCVHIGNLDDGHDTAYYVIEVKSSDVFGAPLVVIVYNGEYNY